MLWTDAIRTLRRALDIHFPGEGAGAVYESAAVLGAIVMGHTGALIGTDILGGARAPGPFTLTKLSVVTRLARSTVERKLRRVLERGMVEAVHFELPGRDREMSKREQGVSNGRSEGLKSPEVREYSM